ncbi:hypothetical protein EON80_32380 [bacterium]|nr:MAG: hypothetical protein EON80_32380 [bacterium]
MKTLAPVALCSALFTAPAQAQTDPQPASNAGALVLSSRRSARLTAIALRNINDRSYGASYHQSRVEAKSPFEPFGLSKSMLEAHEKARAVRRANKLAMQRAIENPTFSIGPTF